MSIDFGSLSSEAGDVREQKGGKFGLNKGKLTGISYNEEFDAVDITVEINDRDYNRRIFNVNKVYGQHGEITDTSSEEYKTAHDKELKQRAAVIIHAIKSTGVTQEEVEHAIEHNPTTFKEWALALIGTVPADYNEKEYDIFLEYEWNIRDGQTRTWPQLPKKMTGGYFLTPTVPHAGTWNEEYPPSGGMRYVDQNGKQHPFARTKNYMESPKANQKFNNNQKTGASTSINGNSGGTAW